MDITYFNPHSQSEADFLASFVARQEMLDFFLRQLRSIGLQQGNSHFLVVAPRGYGKTSLLRRIAIAMRTEPDLSRNFIALTFREEQHNVISLDIFWRNCLQSLLEAREDEGAEASELTQLEIAWQKFLPRQALKRQEQDGEPAWLEFQSHCERLGRRPLLLIDNLDTLLEGLEASQNWKLRKILQSSGGPVLIAAASRYPASTQDVGAAFYNFFRIQTLDKLGDEEVMHCLSTMAGKRGEAGAVVQNLLVNEPRRIKALNTLAGGNPRTLSVLYTVLESHLNEDVLSQLGAMLDIFTSWYGARTEELPIQTRAVFDALALNWDPMTAAALGEITGQDTTAVSSHLSRLEKAGYVEAVSLSMTGKGRNGYQVSERFFNIWYLMRNGPRRVKQNIRFLTVFLESIYSSLERKALAKQVLDAGSADTGYCVALASGLRDKRLCEELLTFAESKSRRMGLAEEYRPIIEEVRNQRLRKVSRKTAVDAVTPKGLIAERDEIFARFTTTQEAELTARLAQTLVDMGFDLGLLGQAEEALACYDAVLARFDTATELSLCEQIARALVSKGTTLGQLGRAEEEIACYDTVLTHFDTATELSLREQVARALFNKGITLDQLERAEEAIACYDAVLTRFDTATQLPFRERVAWALVSKGFALAQMGRAKESLFCYDAVLTRFHMAAELRLREAVCWALFNKGFTLEQMGHAEESIVCYDAVVSRFDTATELSLRERVAGVLVGKGSSLEQLGRTEEAIACFDAVLTRFDTATELPLREQVARALVGKGLTLGEVGRAEEAIVCYDAVLSRYDTATELPLREGIAWALFKKGDTLSQLECAEEAIACYDEVLTRFDTAMELPLRERIVCALLNKGSTLGKLGRDEEAIVCYDTVLISFNTATELALREGVARALINKGVFLGQLGDDEAAITCYDAVLTRFDTATELPLREGVARALVNKALTLGQLGLFEEGMACYDAVLTRFGTATEQPLRELVARVLVDKGNILKSQNEYRDAAIAYRSAINTDVPNFAPFVPLGNLYFDDLGNLELAKATYEEGIYAVPEGDDLMLLKANYAYCLALHDGDASVIANLVQQVLENEEALSTAGRLLLQALPALTKSSGTDWTAVFEQIGKAVECEDANLWSIHLDDLQRLLWFVIRHGQGKSLRTWMEEAGYPQRFSPLYHAFVAALEGEEHLLRVNPETRKPAEILYKGLAKRLKLYGKESR